MITGKMIRRRSELGNEPKESAQAASRARVISRSIPFFSYHFTRDHFTFSLFSSLAIGVYLSSLALAGGLDEFRVKREAVFEFAERPTLTRNGDQVTIAFASKGFCDVTVAVEDAGGRIVRHLASGVLGPKAPPPLQRDSLKQTLVWDGKDDQERYIDDKGSLAVRVSLGLKPAFERTLLWEPKRRISVGPGMRPGNDTESIAVPTPLIRAAPEGVYVFEGHGVDHVRLFDHEGNYVRTVYPFPADKVDKVVGLRRQVFPQDGKSLPVKTGFLDSTMLTSGLTGTDYSYYGPMFGSAATAMAVRGSRLALFHKRLNRLGTDGTSSGLPIEGPAADYSVRLTGTNIGRKDYRPSPVSAAFSPDAKWLYLAGFQWRHGRSGIDIAKGCLHGVVRLAYERDDPPQPFVGSMKQDESGTDNAHFVNATSVDVDAKGRVYVSDYGNDRIQVFAEDGKFLKSIPSFKPARVVVHQRTGEVYVFSWCLDSLELAHAHKRSPIHVEPTLTRYGPLESPAKLATYPLPLLGHEGKPDYLWEVWGGQEYYAELDSWTDPPTIWLVPASPGGKLKWADVGIRLLAIEGGKLVEKRDFGKEAVASLVRVHPPMFWRQRLYVNPKTGMLYVGEGQTAWCKAFYEVLQIDPETGAVRRVKLPFDAEDMAFDQDGLVYLRTYTFLARYDPTSWREVPFDYGEKRENVGTGASTPVDYERARVTSGIPLYGMWHLGGMYVSAKGHIALQCMTTKGDSPPPPASRTDEKRLGAVPWRSDGIAFQPRLYPGRLWVGEVHVFNRHGELAYLDALPGLVPLILGIGLDKDDNLYLVGSRARVIEGKPYFNLATGTLMKVKPNQAKLLTVPTPFTPIPLSDDRRPKREPDVTNGWGDAWAEGAEWLYGGVGWNGKLNGRASGGCACWNARFALDYFARSFAPETIAYKVAVLDSSGNLILRIGQYGNVDDGTPLVPKGGPTPVGGASAPRVRSIGGDEVALFHPCYLATQTDRRLFIADPGNSRILSVALGYHATQRVSLKDATEAGREKVK